MLNEEPLSDQIFKTANLCVVGNINRDIKLAPLTPGSYLFEDGETPVEWTAESVGGGGANSACAAAALEARVGFLGKVGSDGLGHRLEEVLVRHGVTAHLSRSAACSTGTSVNLAFTDGRRHFLSSLPNNEALSFEDLDLKALHGYDHMHRADVWFSVPMLQGGNEQLFRYARKLGIRTSLDINWDPQWGTSSNPETIRERKLAVRKLLPWVNLAHGNTRELMEFTGAGDLESSLRQLEEWGVEAVIIHLGAGGAGCYERGTLVVVPAVLAARQVNSTGTGDALSVCMMLLDWDKGIPVKAKLGLANRIVSEFIEGRRKLIPSL
jgi:sugar/nucleoside kinase (ribokinase family)